MQEVRCRFPVTYSGKRYKPGDVFHVEDKYIGEVLKCCDCVKQPEEQKVEQDSGKQKPKKASK